MFVLMVVEYIFIFLEYVNSLNHFVFIFMESTYFELFIGLVVVLLVAFVGALIGLMIRLATESISPMFWQFLCIGLMGMTFALQDFM